MAYKHFEDLPIWKLAREQHQSIVVWTLTDGFSKDFRLCDQIRAASGSVMDNIAEGFGRGGNKEFINFLTISRGSNEEARSQAYQALDRGYLTEADLNAFVTQSQALCDQINAFIHYLQNSEMKGSKFNR